MDDLLEECWQALLDKDDRTSPAEYPDMCLITRAELAAVMTLSAVVGIPATVEEIDRLSERNRRLKEANDAEHRRLVASKDRQRQRAIRAEQRLRELGPLGRRLAEHAQLKWDAPMKPGQPACQAVPTELLLELLAAFQPETANA
jgi:hypothetical protein